MKPPDNPLPPEDPEALLRFGLRDTTPDFERRWANLKRELRKRPVPLAAADWRHWWWVALPASGALVLALVLVTQTGHSPSPTPTELAAYEELFRLEDELQPALPLSERTLLDVLLAMPAPSLDPS